MSPFISQLLTPYRDISLSAFDNVKLLQALLVEQAESCECFELSPTDGSESRTFYCIKWQNSWFDCGWNNDYSATISSMETPTSAQLNQARKLEVPLLTTQQISFMCMQYNHFDHC